MEAVVGSTLIVVTAGGGGGGGGAVTVRVTLLLLTPWAEAMICTLPAVIPVAIPADAPSELTLLTVATPVLELAQTKAIPFITVPYWS